MDYRMQVEIHKAELIAMQYNQVTARIRLYNRVGLRWFLLLSKLSSAIKRIFTFY